jgi:hypothetical protein
MKSAMATSLDEVETQPLGQMRFALTRQQQAAAAERLVERLVARRQCIAGRRPRPKRSRHRAPA